MQYLPINLDISIHLNIWKYLYNFQNLLCEKIVTLNNIQGKHNDYNEHQSVNKEINTDI